MSATSNSSITFVSLRTFNMFTSKVLFLLLADEVLSTQNLLQNESSHLCLPISLLLGISTANFLTQFNQLWNFIFEQYGKLKVVAVHISKEFDSLCYSLFNKLSSYGWSPHLCLGTSLWAALSRWWWTVCPLLPTLSVQVFLAVGSCHYHISSQ